MLHKIIAFLRKEEIGTGILKDWDSQGRSFMQEVELVLVLEGSIAIDRQAVEHARLGEQLTGEKKLAKLENVQQCKYF